MEGRNNSHDDYHAHISTIMHTPSLIHGVPHYPNVHKAKKRVQLMDHHQQKAINNETSTSSVKTTGVDSEAEGFIQQKRKGFELCKWKTFRL